MVRNGLLLVALLVGGTSQAAPWNGGNDWTISPHAAWAGDADVKVTYRVTDGAGVTVVPTTEVTTTMATPAKVAAANYINKGFERCVVTQAERRGTGIKSAEITGCVTFPLGTPGLDLP